MDARDELTEAFDRGFREGLDSLNLRERELYLIQEFIIAYEMGGLSGFFYNQLPNVAAIAEIVRAMRTHGLVQVADLLEQAAALFQDGTWPEGLSTWDQVRSYCDPADQMTAIDRQIGMLDDFGLSEFR